MRRVFITGLGLVSPIGANVREYWNSLLEESRLPDQGYAELADRIANRYIYIHDGILEDEAEMGRATALSLEAVRQALEDAGIAQDYDLRCGAMVGTTMGDEAKLEAARPIEEAPSARQDYPFQVASAIARRFGLYGPNLQVSNACTSGLYAVDLAADAIRRGEADAMVCGGVECASRIVLSCFNRLGALDEGKCRPFDRERKGTVLGEGAAYVVLESEQSLAQRGHAHSYCEYKRSGWSCDAYQTTAPEPSGQQIERALNEALEKSGLVPTQIDCILPHATGTPLNDALEARLLEQLFGASPNPPAITAIKSKIGHNGGASGVFSVVTACLIFEHGRLPATANLQQMEQEFSLPIPLGDAMDLRPQNLLVNAYAFGGNNISVVLGKP